MKLKFNKTKRGLKAIVAGLFLLSAQAIDAQCTASFTPIVGSNGSVNFQNTSTGTTISTYYSWNFGDGAVSSNLSPAHTYTNSGWMNVCLTIISNTTVANSCTSTVCDSIYISTTPSGTTTPCQANFAVSLGANGYASFVSTSTGTSATSTYTWSFGTTGPSASQTYSANGVYTVCLALTNSVTGCNSSTCQAFTISNVTTAPSGTPCQASFNYTLGANGLANFASNSTGTSGTTIYSWSFGAFGANASNTYTSNGVKMVCLTISDTSANCSSTYCDSLLITNVTNSTICNPSVVYTLSKDSTTALTWNAYPTYPSNITGATWTWGDGSSSTGLYPSHTYSAAGTYSTCVTVSVSCGTITATYCYVAAIWKGSDNNDMIQVNVKSSSPTGLKNNTRSEGWINIYPNPSNGEFTLDLNNGEKQNIVTIYNMMGEKVFEKQLASNGKQSVNVSHLANGTYFVNVNSGNASLHKKITIQK
ncbi:MAG: T9SS type A sorting domain-containing protein [Bacteroidia bacterium]|nr:T9SS type A sorting domain-containing protein [Bacteroidia bacterium]